VYLEEFRWNGVKVKGRKEFISYIVEKNLVDDLISDIKAKAADGGVLLPPEINLYEVDAKASAGDKDGKTTGQISGDAKKKDSDGGEDIPKKRKGKKSS